MAKMSVSVKILGAKRSAANIRMMDKAARKKFFEEMKIIAQVILKHSQDVYVPFDEGDLKESASMTVHPGQYPSVSIGYGNAEVDYAVIQHENPLFEHPGGKSWKYLEKAVNDYESDIQTLLAEPLRTELGKFDMRGKVSHGG